MIIAPSILSADFANLEKEIKAVIAAGADWIHVDVMDGHFVDNLTIGVPVVASLKKVSSIPLDVHLMITDPQKYAEAFIKAGAHYLTFHIEACPEPQALIKKIKSLGAKPGLSLRPRTPLSAITPFLSDVDLVLVMTVEPGFGGQSFMQDQVSKITELKKIRTEKKFNYLIEVDGGVNDQTLHHLKDADALVAGNFIFRNSDYKKAIEVLKK